MGELTQAIRMLSNANFPTGIRQIDYPIHKGAPNPKHGKFHFTGRCPLNKDGTAPYFDTEAEALQFADNAGMTRIQRLDCSFYKGGTA